MVFWMTSSRFLDIGRIGFPERNAPEMHFLVIYSDFLNSDLDDKRPINEKINIYQLFIGSQIKPYRQCSFHIHIINHFSIIMKHIRSPLIILTLAKYSRSYNHKKSCDTYIITKDYNHENKPDTGIISQVPDYDFDDTGPDFKYFDDSTPEIDQHFLTEFENNSESGSKNSNSSEILISFEWPKNTKPRIPCGDDLIKIKTDLFENLQKFIEKVKRNQIDNTKPVTLFFHTYDRSIWTKYKNIFEIPNVNILEKDVKPRMLGKLPLQPSLRSSYFCYECILDRILEPSKSSEILVAAFKTPYIYGTSKFSASNKKARKMYNSKAFRSKFSSKKRSKLRIYAYVTGCDEAQSTRVRRVFGFDSIESYGAVKKTITKVSKISPKLSLKHAPKFSPETDETTTVGISKNQKLAKIKNFPNTHLECKMSVRNLPTVGLFNWKPDPYYKLKLGEFETGYAWAVIDSTRNASWDLWLSISSEMASAEDGIIEIKIFDKNEAFFGLASDKLLCGTVFPVKDLLKVEKIVVNCVGGGDTNSEIEVDCEHQ